MAWALAFEELKQITDYGDSAVLLLLDLSQAFNTLHHPIVLHHPRETGLDGKVVSWIATFLAGHT